MILYHVTKSDNVASIMKNGLIPTIGERSNKYGEMDNLIYCFASMEDVEYALENWLGEEFNEDDDLTVLKINVDDSKVTKQAFEYVINDVVSPNDISVYMNNI